MKWRSGFRFFFYMEHNLTWNADKGSINLLSSTCGAFAFMDGLDWIVLLLLDNGMEYVWSARHARATLYITLEFRG